MNIIPNANEVGVNRYIHASTGSIVNCYKAFQKQYHHSEDIENWFYILISYTHF